MQDADETFRLGIARGAAPLERLQAKHTGFQKRMMAGALAPAASASSTTHAAVPTAAPKRRILGDASKKPPAPLSAQPRAPTRRSPSSSTRTSRPRGGSRRTRGPSSARAPRA
jgi:hypothetical protein